MSKTRFKISGEPVFSSPARLAHSREQHYTLNGRQFPDMKYPPLIVVPGGKRVKMPGA